jgi:hypothetical protein
MFAAEGPATALETPGTISKRRPASPRASASSPPRAKTTGSPAMSRSTRRPDRAARIITASIAR